MKVLHSYPEGTQGTETSKYLEEKKEKRFLEKEKLDFLSSGERKGKSLNQYSNILG